MSGLAEAILARALARGATGIVSYLAGKGREYLRIQSDLENNLRGSKDFTEAAQRTAASILALNSHDEHILSRAYELIQTPEVGELIRGIYAVRLPSHGDPENLAAIEEKFILLWEREVRGAGAKQVWQLLLDLSQQTLDIGLANGNLQAIDFKAAFRHRFLTDTLSAIS